MARVITFKLQLEGEKAVIEKTEKVNVSLLDGVEALELFDNGSKAFLTAAQRAVKLGKELDNVNAKLKGLGGAKGGAGVVPPIPERTAKSYEELVEKAKRLREENDKAASELQTLQKAAKEGIGRTDEQYQKLINRIVELKGEQNGLTKNLREQTREFEAQKFAAGSYRDLNAQLGKARATYREMSKEARDGIAGKEQLENIKKLDKQLKELDKTMGLNVRNVGNYRDAVSQVNKLIAGFKAFEVFGVGAREIVQANADISDSIADVRKTTQLSRGDLEGYDDAVINLTDSLTELDTRTSLADLLDISRIGGQLGIGSELVNQFKELSDSDPIAAALKLEEAQKELDGFTQAIDQVNVALGDELEGGVEGISSDLGKLNELLRVRGELGVSGGILAIGSAINTLGAAGTAQGSKIVAFTKRLAGIAPQANISAPALLGLGAALDEFGQAPELAATAISKFLIGIGEDVPRFAEIAGLSVKELSDLLKEDGNEAFLAVLEGAKNTGGGLEELSGILTELGVDSARSASVIGALTGNLDRVKEVQALANEQFAIARGEMEGNLSITEEFNVKNQTLGAELEKLKNTFISLVVGSGFQDFLAEGVRGLIGFGQAIKSIPEFIKEYRVELGLLIVALISFNATSIIAAASTLKLAIVTKAKAAADRIATASQWALNAALTANPIGVVIGLIALLVAGAILLYKNFDEITEAVTGAWQRVKDFSEGTGILNKYIALLIFPIKALIFTVKNFGAIWSGVEAAARQAIDNIAANFKKLAINAEILQLKLKKAFTFGGEAKKSVQAQIDALDEAKKKLEADKKPIAEAFATAFTEAREKAQAEALKREKAQQAEREADAQKAAERERAMAQDAATRKAEDEAHAQRLAEEKEGKKTAKEREARDKEQAEKEKKERDKRTEDAIKAEREKQERLAKERLEAAKKIAELEAQAAGDEIGRQSAEVELSAEQDISGLVGDPDQIVRQTELVRAQLAKSLKEIFDDGRQLLLDNASEQVEGIAIEGALLPSVEDIAEQADAITTELDRQTNALFDRQATELTTSAEDTIKALVGDPETIKTQSEAIRAQLDSDLKALQEQRAAFNDELEAEELVRLMKVRELQIMSLEQQFEQEKITRKTALTNKIEEITQQAEAEIIASEDAKRLIKEAEEEAEEEELEAEQEFIDKKADIIIAGSEEFIALQAEAAAKEAEIAKQKADQILAEEDRIAKGRQAALNAGLGLLNSFVKDSKDLLSRDEENKKKYGKTLKALSLAEIGINLVRELSSINAVNTRFGEPFDTIIKVATAAKAIISAGIAVQKINSQEFEFGGKLPDGGGMYRGADGQLHTQATATVVGVDQAFIGSSVQKGLPGYRPEGSVYVLGTGYVPEQGVVVGASHSQGGVKVVNEHGDLMELEGGEYLLRNGRESYIINKRSTSLFGRQLNQLSSGSAVYSPTRKAIASSLNAYRGFGVPFVRMQEGGELFAPETTGLATTIVPPPQVAPVNNQAINTEVLTGITEQNALLRQHIGALERKVDAMQNQLLTMKIISDPKEMVKAGLKEIEEENNTDGF